MMNKGITISDIHNIRKKNYEQTKHLSNKELIQKTKEQAKPGWERIAAIRKELVNVSQ